MTFLLVKKTWGRKVEKNLNLSIGSHCLVTANSVCVCQTEKYSLQSIERLPKNEKANPLNFTFKRGKGLGRIFCFIFITCTPTAWSQQGHGVISALQGWVYLRVWTGSSQAEVVLCVSCHGIYQEGHLYVGQALERWLSSVPYTLLDAWIQGCGTFQGEQHPAWRSLW